MHIDACLSLGGRLGENQVFADRLRGGEIVFKKRSVGATVNAILMASSAEGESIIRGSAREPHIDALIDFLISCGAEITRQCDNLYISGRELHGGKITIIGDMIEAGTYFAAGLITGGEVTVSNCPTRDMESVFSALSSMGVLFEYNGTAVKNRILKSSNSVRVIASPYPGFPTDLQPLIAPLLAAFSGGEIIDTVWQTRFGYLESLSAFGIDYEVNDNLAKIKPSVIKNGISTAPDLRGGMACLLAALTADGNSEILSADTILRGYENLEEKLCTLGADIRIENT